MPSLKRIRVTWAGAPVVGPGVSTFYQGTMADASGLAGLVTFFTSLAGIFPAGITWQIPSSGDTLQSETGELAGSWSFPGAGGVVGSSGPSAFVNGVGCRVKWRTAGVHKDRRVVGSTFLVPLASERYEGAGNLTGVTVSAIQTAADALVAAMGGDMFVYSRPTSEVAADGAMNAVTSAQVPDLVSWLRSRRT